MDYTFIINKVYSYIQRPKYLNELKMFLTLKNDHIDLLYVEYNNMLETSKRYLDVFFDDDDDDDYRRVILEHYNPNTPIGKKRIKSFNTFVYRIFQEWEYGFTLKSFQDINGQIITDDIVLSHKNFFNNVKSFIYFLIHEIKIESKGFFEIGIYNESVLIAMKLTQYEFDTVSLL